MLQVESLQKSFDGFMAVLDANLLVEKGDIVAVIGPNGAGKTTLFNLITGQLKPNGGSVRFKGKDISGMPPYRICHMGLSRSFQIVNIFHRMTVFDNVQIAVLSNQKKILNFLTPAHNMVVERTEEILVEGLAKALPEAGFIAEEGTAMFDDQEANKLARGFYREPYTMPDLSV